MGILLALLVALSPVPHARAGGRHNCFTVHEKRRCFLELGSALLGPDCPYAKGAYNCAAARALAAAIKVPLADAELEGGRNPGALLCKKLAGSLEVGADWAGNQEAICVFGDGTMVTATSLWLQREEAAAAAAPPSAPVTKKHK
ncbi:MAG: DUF333 domain-containing protein [Deltaproteobacteria bacterium]|nr:DUF333 domain-containing protein [Deltaproteobacteria bacterium]